MRTVPELPRRRGGALNHGRPGVPPLRNAMRRRVREAAPYMGWNLRDGRVWGPPLRRIWKRSLLFRRGRTLAGPSRKFCHSRANPHPPRFARHLPPERGKALWEGQIPIPSVSLRSISPLDKRFRSRVGEALGPPADPWKPGGPVCRPYGFTRVHSKHWAGG